MITKLVRSTALATALAFGTITVSGCIGSNALFNKLRDWNGTLGDRWVNSLVHFALWIGPYEIALIGDLLIINTIEFWSGENPVTKDSVAVSENDDVVSVRVSAGDSAIVVQGKRGEPAHVYRDGALIGMGEPSEDGDSWIFYDLEGGETRVASAEELAAALPKR